MAAVAMPSCDVKFMQSLACIKYGMKPEEVINASTYRTFETYLPLALLYLLLTWPLSHLTSRLERGIRNGTTFPPR